MQVKKKGDDENDGEKKSKNLKPQKLDSWTKRRDNAGFFLECVLVSPIGVKSFTEESDELVPKHQILLFRLCSFRPYSMGI